MKPNEPPPWPKDGRVEGLIPDSSMSWVVAYAGPGLCKEAGCDQSHVMLFLVPVIGYQIVIEDDDFGEEHITHRPAIMMGDGVIRDYYAEMPEEFRFISVLRSRPQAVEEACAIYHARYEEAPALHHVDAQLNAN